MDARSTITALDVHATLASMTLEEKVALLTGRDYWSLYGVERLGVPSIVVADGPYGLRKERTSDAVTLGDTVAATCFPTLSALAAAWDPALVEEVATAIGTEARAQGVSVVLGPGANIKRTPLCGRNFEYFSEDPVLSSTLGAAWIRGVQEVGVGASLKHLAANNQELRRFTIDALVDERALREIYLASFERAVVDARPWTVMAAYNRLNGTYCTEHRELLTGILRDEWGFDGVVLSDWGAVHDRPASVEAGLDLEMPGFGGRADAELHEALGDGRLSLAAVDAAAARILTLIARTAGARRAALPHDPETHHELARRAAAEGTVLLKNEGGIVPVSPGARIAVVGAFAQEPRFQGAGSAQVNPYRVDNALTALGVLLEPSGHLVYAPGYPRRSGEVDEALLAEACDAARDADVVLVFVGLAEIHETEGVDRRDLRLPAGHDALVEAVAATNPRVVVVLANGAPVAMPWHGRVPAIVEGYLGGQAGGSAMARVLLGAMEPGGRLAETVPHRWEDNPVHAFPSGPRQIEYRESLYVGYRWYDTAGADVLFPFGHGLSTTTFSWSEAAAGATTIVDGDGIDLGVTVTNTGKRAGSEVVQVYVHALDSIVFRPDQELRAFSKVHLAPGESQRITVRLERRAFAHWDPERRTWAVQPGHYAIRLGASSRDIRATLGVEVTSRNPIHARPEAADPVLAPYHDLADHRGFPRAAFAALYGRPLPSNSPEPFGRYTLSTPLADMHDSLPARLLHAAMRRATRRFVGGPADSPMALLANSFVEDAALRMLPLVTRGVVTGRMLRAFLLIANGRHGLGVRTLLRAAWAGRRRSRGRTT
jgi:beta-glucosidase